MASPTEWRMRLGDKPIVSAVTIKVPEGRSEEMIQLAANVLGLRVWKSLDDGYPWYRFFPLDEAELKGENRWRQGG